MRAVRPATSRTRGCASSSRSGFFDFVALEQAAFCVLSDSGTVQEECCIFRVPNVTIRDVTERPETIECGSNMLAGADPERVLRLRAHRHREPAGLDAAAGVPRSGRVGRGRQDRARPDPARAPLSGAAAGRRSDG